MAAFKVPEAGQAVSVSDLTHPEWSFRMHDAHSAYKGFQNQQSLRCPDVLLRSRVSLVYLKRMGRMTVWLVKYLVSSLERRASCAHVIIYTLLHVARTVNMGIVLLI